MTRAYSLLSIKAVDAAQRIVEGLASTPTPDRGGDVMVPEGAQFTLPMPFLWKHEDAIGEVFYADVRPEGIYIKAQFSKLAASAPASLKARIEEAWHSVSADPPLARGLSIGWAGVESEPIPGTRFTRYLSWIWGETSVVPIPMNAEATILAVKSFDTPHAAGTPVISPLSAGPSTVVRLQKAARPMTTQEQITSFENSRAAKAAAMNTLMTKAAETGSTLDAAQTEEYDTAALEVKAIDAHLVRLHDLEKTNLVKATPITGRTPELASEQRGGHVPVITATPQLAKGTAFTRMCMALARGKGDSYQTLQHAKSWADTPEVESMIEHMWRTKAAVAVGTTTDATWAAPLVVRQPVNEFLELLRPRTLLGQIQGLKQVPFNVSVGTQSSGGTYNWVGQGLAKPVTSAAYAATTLDFAKAAGIIVLTEELVKLSTPSAEGLVREEMIAGMSQFLDLQFVDPAVAAVANLNPASITNGASTAAASGTTSAAARTDLAGRVAVFTAAGIPLTGSVWLMNDSNAFGIGVSVNPLGNPLFPGVGINGGSIHGIPVVVSNNVGNKVILMHAPSILFADEGGVQIDVSREASVQMDSAPDSPTTASTVLVSLWQNNLVGLRAERMITWKRARTAAVTYLTGAAYAGT